MIMKVCTLFLLTVLCFTNSTFGQTREIKTGGFEFKLSSVDTTLNYAFCLVGQMPEFPGGMPKLISFAKGKIHYPKSAVNDSVEESVVLNFAIDKKGRVTNKRIFKSVRYDLNKVCLRMLKHMPRWKTGRLNGEPLAINLMWTITFILID